MANREEGPIGKRAPCGGAGGGNIGGMENSNRANEAGNNGGMPREGALG